MSPGDSMDPQAILDQRAADYARMRVYPLASALIHIANHVSAIPGRKNLIWISGGVKAMGSVSPQQNAPLFGTSTTVESQHLPDKLKLSDMGYRLSEPKYVQTQQELFRAVIEACNAANVALYSVDVRGLTVGRTGMDVSQRGGSGLVTPSSLQGQLNGLAGEQDVRFVYRQFADGTGGTAFYGNNDLKEGMSKAFDDGRYAYTIGYYPNHGTWKGDFRKIQINVARPDMHARYRDGYYATEDIDGLQTDPEKQIQEMGNSPLDSTALSMMVSVRHMKTQPASTLGAEHELEFQVGVDVAQLLLEQGGGHRKGSIDLVFIQRDEKGQALAAEKKHVDLDFSDAQYQGLLTAGAIFERHLVLNEQAKDVRVLVRDGGSGQIGTVTVALKGFVGK
jgi:VWFA-related protein